MNETNPTIMNLFGEPIGTWLSIAAFLISFSALLLAWRKQRSEEQAMLARHLSELKTEYGEILRVLGRIGSLFWEFNSIYTGASYRTGKHRKSELSLSLESLKSLRSKLTDLYNKIGKIDPIVTDPVTLSSLVVEARHMKNDLDELNSKLTGVLGPTIKKLQFVGFKTDKSRKRSGRRKFLMDPRSP